MSEVRIKDITAVFTVDSQPTQASGFVSLFLFSSPPNLRPLLTGCYLAPVRPPQPPRAGTYVGGEDQGHHRRLHRRLAADPSFRFPLFPSLFSSPPNLGLFLQGVIWP